MLGPPKSKYYCLSHSRACRIQKSFLSVNHGDRQYLSVFDGLSPTFKSISPTLSVTYSVHKSENVQVRYNLVSWPVSGSVTQKIILNIQVLRNGSENIAGCWSSIFIKHRCSQHLEKNSEYNIRQTICPVSYRGKLCVQVKCANDCI